MTEHAVAYAPAYEVILPGNALVLAPEARYVTETPTGLRFAPDTPIEVWGALVERLVRQHKRIEWAIGDAINFAESAYEGHKYEQWVEQTGLAENTLATIRWVAARIEPSRRREDVGWSHHREVAPLPPDVQDRLLDEAADKGMTRWDVRQAVKVEQAQLEGRAVDAAGEPICSAELAWVPDVADLKPEVRDSVTANAPLGRLRSAWISGVLWWMVYRGDEDAFLPGRWRAG